MEALIRAKLVRLREEIISFYKYLDYDIKTNLERYGLSIEKLDEFENLPVIIEIAKYIMSENSTFPSNWNTFGYYHHAHNKILKECLEDLEPISKKMIEQGELTLDTFETKKFLNISIFPDDFYKELQDQINRAYKNNILPAIQILSRKFLENLIVDILRKKYGFTSGNLELFYDKVHNKFHDFNILIQNLESKLKEFIGVSVAFNKDLLSKINKFRIQGNSSAHTIELQIKKEDIKREAQELEHIIKVLINVYNSLNGI